MAESYEPFWPVSEPAGEVFLSACLTVDYPTAIVRLDRGYRDGQSLGPSVEFEFPNVAAVMVHEEYVHPWNERTSGGTWPKGAHVASVRASDWLRSFSEAQLIGFPDPVHYRFVTEFPIIDVINSGAPSARVVPAPPL